MKRQSGLTLIELLIAIAIMAVLAILASTLLGSSLENQKHLKQSSRSLEDLGLSLTLVRRDLEQMLNRVGRDQYGEKQLAPLLSFAEGDQFLLEFTRDGRRLLPGEQFVSSLERIRYAIEENKLIRYSAAVPDPAANTEWRKQALLDNIEAINFGFLNEGKWERQWPPESTGLNTSPVALPRAVSLRIETRQWGVVELLALVAGGGNVSP